MSDINRALGNFGAPLPVQIGEHTWQLAWADQKILAALSSKMKNDARQAVLALRNDVPETVFNGMMNRLARDLAPPRSLYEPFASKFLEELQDTQLGDNWVYLIWLLLERNHPGLKLDEAAALVVEANESDPGTPEHPGALVKAVQTVLSAAVEDFQTAKKKRMTKETPAPTPGR